MKPTKLLAKQTMIALGCLGLLLGMVPGAAAHPVDGFAFFPGPLGFPNFFPPVTPPSSFLPTITVTDVTAEDVTAFGLFKGAGDCNAIGEACVIFPVWNPFVGAPVVAFDCEITSAVGPWPGLPALFLAQDLDSSRTIDSFGPDLIVSISFLYGSPGGPIPPFVGPAGAYGGGVFATGGGPFIPGIPVHFIAAHPGVPLGPADLFLDLGVDCWVI